MLRESSSSSSGTTSYEDGEKRKRVEDNGKGGGSGGGGGGKQDRRRRPISDEGRRRAIEFGRDVLRRERMELSEEDLHLPDDVEYLGNHFISVMIAEDDRVYAVDVTLSGDEKDIL